MAEEVMVFSHLPVLQCMQQYDSACDSASISGQVPALLARLTAAPRPEVRQLAAQQLRGCLARFWRRLDAPVRPRPCLLLFPAWSGARRSMMAGRASRWGG